MKLKALQAIAKNEIIWPTSSNDLPVLTWDECTSRSADSQGVFF